MLSQPDDLINELDRRLRREDDQRIAAFLMDLLARSAPAQPDRVNQVLERLADSPQWAILGRRRPSVITNAGRLTRTMLPSTS